ncbi:hypothetical protein E2C01_019120 [Portunus trituberculatus]|uniref:Uncharacterized protein n=1 Tax=Portunus trituberculatus TaxID=210409 RepID=A0A5B7DYE0_PORTR|nr:hypothetical protein [Portunus trituberculatus]
MNRKTRLATEGVKFIITQFEIDKKDVCRIRKKCTSRKSLHPKI